MKSIFKFLHVVEFIIISPSFVVMWLFYFFHKDAEKAEEIADKWFFVFSWVVSIVFWIVLYFFVYAK